MLYTSIIDTANKAKIASLAGGIETIIKAMSAHGESRKLQENTCRLLSRLAESSGAYVIIDIFMDMQR